MGLIPQYAAAELSGKKGTLVNLHWQMSFPMKTKILPFLTILAASFAFHGQADVFHTSSHNPGPQPPIPPPPNGGLAPVIMGIHDGQTPGTMNLDWNSVTGQTYQLQFTTDFIRWFDIGPPVAGDGSLIVATQYPSNPYTYYRVSTYR